MYVANHSSPAIWIHLTCILIAFWNVVFSDFFFFFWIYSYQNYYIYKEGKSFFSHLQTNLFVRQCLCMVTCARLNKTWHKSGCIIMIFCFFIAVYFIICFISLRDVICVHHSRLVADASERNDPVNPWLKERQGGRTPRGKSCSGVVLLSLLPIFHLWLYLPSHFFTFSVFLVTTCLLVYLGFWLMPEGFGFHLSLCFSITYLFKHLTVSLKKTCIFLKEKKKLNLYGVPENSVKILKLEASLFNKDVERAC